MANTIKLMLMLFSIFLYGTTAEIVIENNGYSGMVISIHECIPENPLLLESIKNMIKKTSNHLYRTTKQRAYFKHYTIVVPSSWSTSPNYKTVPKDDYMSMAEVRVAPPHPSYGNIPYTMQLGGCGERGQYIHLTSNFLLEINRKTNNLHYGRNSKIFLHEWAHLRYGVFNEYGITGNKKSPLFYKDKNDKIRVNGCSASIKGWLRRSDGKSKCVVDINNNLISDCTFYPYFQTGMTNGSGNASLMYMPELESANEFCEDLAAGVMHNPSAPNMQNRMCNTRSVLDVILSNKDFATNRNMPRIISKVAPDVSIVQLTTISSPKYVLVLDVSGSMSTDNRMKLMQEGTARLLKFHIKDEYNISIGMVSFSSDSTVLSYLTLLNTASRGQLISKIPPTPGGGTRIGNALLKALEVLRQSGGSTEKSKIILLSDGEESSEYPTIKDVIPKIKQAGVVVYSLAIGNQASLRLEELSKSTGGKSEFFNSQTQDKSMDSIMNTIILDSGFNDLLPIINSNRAKEIPRGTDIKGDFNVNNGVDSTTVFISYRSLMAINTGQHPLATLISPDGTSYNHQSPECVTDQILGSIQFRIPNTQTGKWNYTVENPGVQNVHVNIMITSDPKIDANNKTNNSLIRVRSWVNSVNVKLSAPAKIFAEVTKNDNPIVRAKVEAVGYSPNGSKAVITLKDDGLGADKIADDGVYTQFFTRYTGNGRYQIDINVENTPATKMLNKAQSISQNTGAPVMPLLFEEIENEEPSAEFPVKELPQVNEIFKSSAIYNVDMEEDLDFDSMEPVEDFERYNPAGTFLLEDWTGKDSIPPGQITDLHIVRTDLMERTVHLEWTSTGDDMYDGQATSIQLRYHHDSVFLVRSFEQSFSDFEIVNGSLNPLAAYEKHSVFIKFLSEEILSTLNTSRSIYFAVRALDKEGNLGEISNAAIADFPLQEELQTTEDVPVEDVTTEDVPVEDVTTEDVPVEDVTTEDAFPLYISISIAVGSAVFVIILVATLVKVCSKNKKVHVDIDSEQNMGVEYTNNHSQEGTVIVGNENENQSICT